MLKKNLIANYFGQGWVALMSLAFIPLYIKYLGIEAYALIGIFGLLQAWLSLLDMGMMPTLSREMARFKGGTDNAQNIRDLLRSFELMALCVAIIIAVGIWAASSWLASDWLKAEKLPIDIVTNSFIAMGLVTAIRFPEGIFRSCLVGLQHQVLFNVINSALATIRGLGALAVLVWISPSIQVFFIWQGLISLATLVVLSLATYKVLPSADRSGRYSREALKSIGRFAGGMAGINLLTLLLTQIDKILLSRFLILTEYGYYTLAAVAASSLYMLVSPITQAWFPRLSALHASNKSADLIKLYHLGAQLVSVVMGSAAIILIVFAEPIVQLWTQNTYLAHRTAPLVRFLALGNLLNGLMWIPYQTQLAYGWTGIALRINIVSVLIIVPATIWVTPNYGAVGAAWVWASLNAGYVLIGIHLMFRKILIGEKWRWYTQDVLVPLLAATAAALFAHWVAPSTAYVMGQVAIIIVAAILSVMFATLAAPQLRQKIASHLQPYFSHWRIKKL
jgi:O-antigen/teichoic acid export membrane protein